MIAAIPRLAVIAISWIIRIFISMMVIKPMVSLKSAMPPGTSSRRKLDLDAVPLSAPSKTSARKALTICTPWLTAMAKTRNGTKIDIGSMPKPSRVSIPSCHTTAISEHARTMRVSLMFCE